MEYLLLDPILSFLLEQKAGLPETRSRVLKEDWKPHQRRQVAKMIHEGTTADSGSHFGEGTLRKSLVVCRR